MTAFVEPAPPANLIGIEGGARLILANSYQLRTFVVVKKPKSAGGRETL